MKKRHYVLIFALVLMIFTVNALSAGNVTADVNDNSQVMKENVKIDSSGVKTDTEDNNYYVNNKVNNAIEDGTENNPYHNLNQSTVDSVKDNSSIKISNGTYYVGSINFTKSLSIIGANKENTILVADSNTTIFSISASSEISLINITFKDYNSTGHAAIENYGVLNIDDCIFDNNRATSRSSQGGSIRNNGVLNINNSLFKNNFASWGAGVYNFKTCNVYNTLFASNNIQNVGGALYSIRGDLTVNNCSFNENIAVSGAAIYNAFGNLSVDNSEFYKNDAASFFGGAIYSTGFATTTNSKFYNNHANKDGGAITNTNNFTVINCVFEQNSANENGGVIENVPWSANENGNLTLINSTFTDNSAGDKGGVIINYKKEEYQGENSTVTSRNCVFIDNTASNGGGLIYNQQDMDFENNVIIAGEQKSILSDSESVPLIENNWWGVNNPDWNRIGAKAEKWIVMNANNSTAFIKNLKTGLYVSLNTLNNGEKIKTSIPERTVVFSSENATFDNNYLTINGEVNNSVLGNDAISIRIDNEKVELIPKQANLSYTLENSNQTLRLKLNFTENVDGKVTVKVNSNTIVNKMKLENGSLVVDYEIPTIWKSKEYIVSFVVNTKDNNQFRENMTVEIPKRDVSLVLSVNNSTSIKAGKVIQLVANVTMGNKTVDNGKVAFKINGKTIGTNVKVVNGIAILNYTLPTSFSPKEYTVSVVYSGDANKNSANDTTIISLEKQDVHLDINDEISLLSNTNIEMRIGLLDENDLFITNGKICYKINYKTLKTNVTVPEGVFTFDYTTPEVDSAVEQILTVKYSGSSKYNPMETDIKLIIE